MNIEDFVTYEQALKLKELGFKEKCLYYYFNQTLHPNDVYAHRVDRSSFHRVYSVGELGKIHNVAKEPAVCDAPTLWQAQKWFRKEKHISIESNGMSIDKWDLRITNLDKEEAILLYFPYNSYEEAISEGITEYLKLLEKDNNHDLNRSFP